MNLVCKCIQAFNFSYAFYVECVLGSRECQLLIFIVFKCSEIAPFCMEKKSYPIWLLQTLSGTWNHSEGCFIILIVLGCRTVVFLGVLHGLHYLQHCTITTLEKAVYFTDACLVISLLCYNGRFFVMYETCVFYINKYSLDQYSGNACSHL